MRVGQLNKQSGGVGRRGRSAAGRGRNEVRHNANKTGMISVDSRILSSSLNLFGFYSPKTPLFFKLSLVKFTKANPLNIADAVMYLPRLGTMSVTAAEQGKNLGYLPLQHCRHCGLKSPRQWNKGPTVDLVSARRHFPRTRNEVRGSNVSKQSSNSEALHPIVR